MADALALTRRESLTWSSDSFSRIMSRSASLASMETFNSPDRAFQKSVSFPFSIMLSLRRRSLWAFTVSRILAICRLASTLIMLIPSVLSRCWLFLFPLLLLRGYHLLYRRVDCIGVNRLAPSHHHTISGILDLVAFRHLDPHSDNVVIPCLNDDIRLHLDRQLELERHSCHGRDPVHFKFRA